MVKELSPVEIKEILSSDGNIRLIDVREQWEYDLVKIENSELMPLSNFMEHINKLKREDKIIVYCHHGARSYSVCAYLDQNGFNDVTNLTGGIDAWSQEVDTSIPRY